MFFATRSTDYLLAMSLGDGRNYQGSHSGPVTRANVLAPADFLALGVGIKCTGLYATNLAIADSHFMGCVRQAKEIIARNKPEAVRVA